MRELDHIRKPGYIAAYRQIALNAKQPEPTPWWVEWFAALRRWTVTT